MLLVVMMMPPVMVSVVLMFRVQQLEAATRRRRFGEIRWNHWGREDNLLIVKVLVSSRLLLVVTACIDMWVSLLTCILRCCSCSASFSCHVIITKQAKNFVDSIHSSESRPLVI